MASSGSFDLSSNHSQLSAKITWNLQSQSIADNTSSVYAQLWIKKNQSIATSGTWSGSFQVGNNSSGWGLYQQLVDSWVCVSEKTVTISHNADGTGSCYLSGSVKGPSGTSMSSASASGSQTVTLDPIYRTSTVSATAAKIEGSTTITINRASSALTHTLTYSFSGLTGTIATKTSAATVNWTVPTSFYAKFLMLLADGVK